MSWLKQSTAAIGVPKVSIIREIQARVAGFQPARDYRVVHASDVTKTDFCPRRWMFYDLTNTQPPGSYVSTALAVTFDMGYKTAEILAEQWCRDIVVGGWKCRACGHRVNMGFHPGTCSCGADDWKYEEVSFEAKTYGITGSLDVLFKLPQPKLCVVEVKTYSADEFDKMVTPLPEHTARTRLYLRIIAESTNPLKNEIDLEKARVLYVSRGYGKKNDEHGGEILPFREFVVDRKDDHLDVQLALDKAQHVKVYKDQKIVPPGICSTPLDKQAKACSHCKACFSGKYPVGAIL